MYEEDEVQPDSKSERNRMITESTMIDDEEEQQSSSKSLAKQTEESYQLQLALALRLTYRPSFTTDHSSSSAQRLSHHFWVNGCLQYSDKILDGFYLIDGMDAYTWSLSADLPNVGIIPSFESLMSVEPGDDLSIVVVAVDKSRDPGLRELQNKVVSLSNNWITTQEATHQLANLVCKRMGGGSLSEENLFNHWKECTQVLKSCMNSIIFPIGSLAIGLCVHRALLFKVLADLINLPCRIAKGCKYCRKDVGASCIVQFGSDREYLIDLIGRPGATCQPDSSLNPASSMLVASPLCHPKFKTVDSAAYTKTLAQLYFLDSQALHLVFDSTTSSGSSVNHNDTMDPRRTEALGANYAGGSSHLIASKEYGSFDEEDQPSMDYPSHEVDLDEEDLDIPWSELILKENIGTGSFGTVLRADWRGSEMIGAPDVLIDKAITETRLYDKLRTHGISLRVKG
ncbi:unnamed protein product, partial [Sphenostylis stenocarpa]